MILTCVFCNGVLEHEADCTRPAFFASRREEAIVEALSRGLSTLQIARLLGCSERTVKSDVHDVAERHRCANRTHVVATALREGALT